MGNSAILITGAGGFIGWNLARHFEQNSYRILAGYHSSLPGNRLSAAWVQLPLDSVDLKQQILEVAPSAIFHCAAIPGVAACDANRRDAFNINVLASCRIAEAAESLGIPLVYCSTDLVFDGTRGWYDEEDPPDPPTYYGETKLLGEQQSLAICSKTYVLRLALVYGLKESHPAGFLKWTHEALGSGKELHLFENQYRSVLYVNDIAEVVQRLLRKGDSYGIYHMGGPSRLNRLEIGHIFAETFHGATNSILPSWLDRGTTLGNLDDTSLITTKIRSVTGFEFTGFRHGLQEMHQEFKQAGRA